MSHDYRKTPEAIDRLSPLQRKVTQEDATEPAFRNQYWNNHDAGLYVDVVSGQPLFASVHKYDSRSGWPSFTRPIQGAVRTRTDHILVVARTEVHCRRCGGHLGHVFDDGPPPTGKRYCMNGVAMTFRPG